MAAVAHTAVSSQKGGSSYALHNQEYEVSLILSLHLFPVGPVLTANNSMPVTITWTTLVFTGLPIHFTPFQCIDAQKPVSSVKAEGSLT